ncbi:MAG: aldose epimerase, partial [Oscillatoriales cyanobacterium SM2_1_8]|nr:aldose epimerase [Oscillatoriales cyanobacterium SM2_1_8]
IRSTRWRRGQDIFYMDEERFRDPALSVRGGNPVLFPICGNLAGDRYTLDGQTYALPQHGFARNRPWQVVAQSVDDEGAQLTVGLTASPETRTGYPFDFDLQLTYRLQGAALVLTATVANHGDRPLPFCLGFHPYFAVADKTALQLDIPATAWVSKSGETQEFTGTLDWDQAEIDIAFADLQNHTASVQTGDRRLTLTFDPTYTVLVFWTVQGKPFYCLEPWSAPRNAFNPDPGQPDRRQWVEPGQTHTNTLKYELT